MYFAKSTIESKMGHLSFFEFKQKPLHYRTFQISAFENL